MVWAASQPVVAGISNSVFLFSLAFVLLFRDKIVQVLRIGALALAFVVAKVFEAFEMFWRFQWSQFIAKAESKLRTAGNTTALTPQKPRHDKSPARALKKADRVNKIIISDKVKKTTPTKRVGGSWVTGARVSATVAAQLEEEWPTMNDLRKATHNQIKEFKEKTGVNNSVQNLKALVMALREHLA